MLSLFLRHHGTKGRHYHSLIDELAHRGFIQDVTRKDDLIRSLARKQTVYTGVDPTAPSLHIGHLIPLLSLVHFHLRGHRIIPLIGSATGRIGDPSGRTVERKLAHEDQVNKNVASLTHSLRSFLTRAIAHASTRLHLPPPSTHHITVHSNLDWHKSFSMIHFLQLVGVHARVNTMLNRESVKARLSSHSGLSFTEFTYQLLQAYDFHHLYTHEGCTIQIGGSDQWGNILAGIELIGKLAPHTEPYGITTPLLTTSSGEKFGKSAGNAVWLDHTLTSVFDFYQYFLKVTDADLRKYLNLFTFLSRDQIAQVVQTHETNPEKRTGQRKLAEEVTQMVHGEEALGRARTLTALFFSPPSCSTSQHHYQSLTTPQIIAAFEHDDPRLGFVSMRDMLSVPVCKLAAGSGEKKSKGLVASISASRALIASRGLYVNNVPVSDITQTIRSDELVDGQVAVVRAGKEKVMVLVGVKGE